MNRIAIAAAVAAIFGSAAGAASAQTAPAPAAPAAPSLGAVLAATPGLSITGYVASTYDYFNTSSTSLRAYDVKTNGFSVNQAAASIAYLPTEGFGAQVVAIAGNDAKILNSGNLTGSPLYLSNAFVQYATGPLTVMAGKFSSLAGAEVTNPAGNNTVSRSILFWNMEPGSLTGLRANYTVSPALTLVAGVNNGWGYTGAQPNGLSKTIELGVTGSPNSMFSYTADYYRGQSPWFGTTASIGVLQLFDFVGTLNATSALSFQANVDLLSKDNSVLKNGTTGTAKANGLALYANYAVTDQIALAARGEYIDDKDGLVSGSFDNKLKELTLAVNYAPIKNVKLAAEIRQDKSDNAIYTKKDGTLTTKQSSLELLAVYSF